MRANHILRGKSPKFTGITSPRTANFFGYHDVIEASRQKFQSEMRNFSVNMCREASTKMDKNFGVNCKIFGLKYREASTQMGTNFGVNCEICGLKYIEASTQRVQNSE